MNFLIVLIFVLKTVLINSEFNDGFPGTVELLHNKNYNNRRSRLSKDFDDNNGGFVPVVPTPITSQINYDDKIQNFADTKNLSPEQKILLKSIVDRAARYGGPILDALTETNKNKTENDDNENTGRGNNSKNNNKIKSSTTRRPLSSTSTKTTIKRTSTSSSSINKSTIKPITDNVKTTGINKKINKNSTPNVQQALNIKPSSLPSSIKKPNENYLSDLSDNVTTAAIIENLSQQTEIAAREDIYTRDRTQSSTQSNNKDKVGRAFMNFFYMIYCWFFLKRFVNT